MLTDRKPQLLSLVLAVVASTWAVVGHAQATLTWSSTPTNGNWNVASNWTSGTAPVANDSLVFVTSTTTSLNNNITAGTQFNGITFNSGASAYTINGNQIALGGSMINNSTTTQNISTALALSATQTFNAASGGINLAGSITGAGGLTKTGTSTLLLSGGVANTYAGTTTISGGALSLNKTSSVTAVPGNLTISNAIVTFNSASNQIADSAAVTMSGTSSVFNGTSYNQGWNLALNETIGSLAVTGGLFMPGGATSSTGFAVTGSASFTGGAYTQYLHNSGGLASFGSLALVGMTGTTATIDITPTANLFAVSGNNARQSTVTVGSGGLSLDGSNIILMLGNQGSRVVLNGNVTTTGSTASSIAPPAITMALRPAPVPSSFRAPRAR